MKNALPIFTCICLLVFFGCKKEKAPDAISTTPELKFVSISPGSVLQYNDSITIVISYTDGDGDLGENNANINNLFVTDSRNGVQYNYRVKQLAPSDANIAIKGNLNVVLKNTALVDTNKTSESVTYSIFMNDRAGHASNTVTSSAITIVK